MNKTLKLPLINRRKRHGLRVTMLGIRGFPDVQGGVEKHAEKLACALATLGCDVEAVVRSCYVGKGPARWQDVKLTRVWAPHVTGLEAFLHTFLGVLRAGLVRPDILHIHSIGPAFFTPLARSLGLRVVVTYHSLNYEHKKWGRLARTVLRLGERSGMTFANGRIAVSEGLAEYLRTYGFPVSTIPNGIDRPRSVRSTTTLQAFGLSPRRYALMVARIDQDKRQLDLIDAYARLRPPDWKVALVGAADHSGGYARAVTDAAGKIPGVVMLGHQTGTALAELYTHAGVFVLPSRFEGQPIAVLEAASYGLPVILSDIASHREIAVARARYFKVGDHAALATHLQSSFAEPIAERLDGGEFARIMAQHDWPTIAQQTVAIYLEALFGVAGDRRRTEPPAIKAIESSPSAAADREVADAT